MKNLFMFILLISCSTKKFNHDKIIFKITDNFLKENDMFELNVINNSSEKIYFYFSNDFEVGDLTDCKYKKQCTSKIIIIDDNDSIPVITGTGYNLSENKQNYKNVNKSKSALYEINSNDKIKLKLPLYFNFYDINNGTTSKFKFEKNRKYFARVEYIPNQKIIDSLHKKGIKVYDKAIVSDKVPIKFE